MTRFGINGAYFQHSTPEYNRKHKEENSKYNAHYYETHKEKWQDNKKSDNDDEDEKKTSKSGSDEEDEKDSKDKKKSGSGGSGSKEKKPLVLNGGSKKGGSATGKKSSSKKSSEKSSEKSDSKKKKETDEEKEKREAEEKAEQERQQEETRKKNTEYAEQLKKFQETLTPEKLKEVQNANKEWEKQNKKKKTVKHSACYVGINDQPSLKHHGRLGMKWGKRNGPPYPLDYSKLSEEERAKDKQRVKDEGDIESVGYKKNRTYFTDQEINEVINRYQFNTRINQLAADSAKMKAGKSKAEQLADKMSKVSDVGFKLANGIQAGTNVYNNVAKVMNAFGDSDLPIIGEKKQEKKKDWKISKKELEGIINDMDKNLSKYSNDDLKTLNMRKAQYDALVKDRNAKVEADKAKKAEKENQAYYDYQEKLKREAEEVARRESGKYRIKFK